MAASHSAFVSPRHQASPPATHNLLISCYLQLSVSYVIVYFSVVDALAGVKSLSVLTTIQAHPFWDKYHLAIVSKMAAVVVASLIAIGIPNFGDFVSFAGAVANTMGIYILPHLAFLLLARNGMLTCSIVERVLSMSIILFGVVTGSIATVVSFMDLVGL